MGPSLSISMQRASTPIKLPATDVQNHGHPGRGLVEMDHGCARWLRPRTIFVRHVHCTEWQRQEIGYHCRMSAFGPKRTSQVAPHMSAFGGSVGTRPGFSRTCACAAMTSCNFSALALVEKTLSGKQLGKQIDDSGKPNNGAAQTDGGSVPNTPESI
jgi:hypothetical protein